MAGGLRHHAGERLRQGRGSSRDLQRVAAAPEPLQVVEGAGARREDVHHEVAVVEQDPLLPRVALDVVGAAAPPRSVSWTASAMATICFWLPPEASTK